MRRMLQVTSVLDGTATWALPMDEGARSSIIRRHVPVSIGAAAPEAGDDDGFLGAWQLGYEFRTSNAYPCE